MTITGTNVPKLRVMAPFRDHSARQAVRSLTKNRLADLSLNRFGYVARYLGDVEQPP